MAAWCTVAVEPAVLLSGMPWYCVLAVAHPSVLVLTRCCMACMAEYCSPLSSPSLFVWCGGRKGDNANDDVPGVSGPISSLGEPGRLHMLWPAAETAVQAAPMLPARDSPDSTVEHWCCIGEPMPGPSFLRRWDCVKPVVCSGREGC
jgi:hypothetical protein